MIPKFKKGRLYLYNPKLGSEYLMSIYNNLPVLACKDGNYSTWLCLLPDGTTERLSYKDLTDITLKKK